MGEGSVVAVLGYASLDYSMNVTRPPAAGQTTLVSERLSHPWPECGGVARFVRPLTRRGAEVSVITWVGTDTVGDEWVREVTSAGGQLTQGSQLEGTSPVSYLMHAGTDLPVCVFDAGVSAGAQVRFSPEMQAAVAESDWSLCSVAPSKAVEALLDYLPEGARLVWVVKADPNAFPTDLRRRLWARANLVILGEAERPFLEEASLETSPGLDDDQSRCIVRTAGSDNITWIFGAMHGSVPVKPLDASVNTVGAGDVFAAALVGEFVNRGSLPAVEDLPQLIAVAADEAREFLLARARPSWPQSPDLSSQPEGKA